MDNFATEEDSKRAAKMFNSLVNNIAINIKGKNPVIHLSCVCLLAGGHLLIEDVPGVGKTTLAKSISESLNLEQSRIQFTPDLLPGDVIGTSIFNQENNTFEFRPGPVFANILLADEINRASPKTQSALLESMEERNVTYDGITHSLPNPHMVIATQNPVELSGTYPLPESQLDRFMMSLAMGYPSVQDEIEILQGSSTKQKLTEVLTLDDFFEIQKIATSIYVSPIVVNYIVSLSNATRANTNISLGISPRGSLALYKAAKVLALSLGRHYVLPDDVKALAPKIWEHRLILTPKAKLEGIKRIDVMLATVGGIEVPTMKER
ncbi:MAG: MoxR family ATPase [Acidimicrobiia bacterium]|nr:MoxR family ATPase [Acidimicrobiia bacterium]